MAGRPKSRESKNLIEVRYMLKALGFEVLPEE